MSELNSTTFRTSDKIPILTVSGERLSISLAKKNIYSTLMSGFTETIIAAKMTNTKSLSQKKNVEQPVPIPSI